MTENHVPMEAKGSDAYRARRLRHNFAKYISISTAFIQDLPEMGLDPRPQQQQFERERNQYRLFEEFDLSVQNILMENICIIDPEVTILASFQDIELWLVVTSRRVIWYLYPVKQELNFDQIDELGSTYGPGKTALDWVDSSDPEQTRYVEKIAASASPWIFIKDKQEKMHEILLPSYSKTEVMRSLQFMVNLDRFYPRADL